MKVLGVIPARGGSTRIPRKNLQKVGPYSLVQHAVNHCRESSLGEAFSDDRFVVSTDDVDIAIELLSQSGSPRVISRKCKGDGPMVDVLLDAVEQVGGADIVLCIQPTSPFRTGHDIEQTIRFMVHTGARSSVSVGPDRERNGAIYATRIEMLRDGLVFDKDSCLYSMPHERSIDINTPADLERARELWSKMHG